MRYLVDTDVLIDFLRGRDAARHLLASLLDKGTLCCSAITVAEIFAGMKKSEADKTGALLDGLDVIDVDRHIAEKAGTYKATVRSHSLELDDCLIAATAFTAEATLVTGNIKHYPMSDIAKISGR